MVAEREVLNENSVNGTMKRQRDVFLSCLCYLYIDNNVRPVPDSLGGNFFFSLCDIDIDCSARRSVIIAIYSNTGDSDREYVKTSRA